MSKKAFGYLRKKRMVPMPSLTSLRKYNKMKGIVLQHNTMRVSNSRKSVKNIKSAKNQSLTKSSNVVLSRNLNDTKVGTKPKSSISTDNVQNSEHQVSQQPILFSSSGELGNVEFLQQTVDDTTGHVITTTLPMMTTTDGTTVVQVSYHQIKIYQEFLIIL